MREMTAVLDKIRAYERILIFRHIRPDGDCVGATKGLKAILQATFPDKDVRIPNATQSEYLSFLGPDDGEASDAEYADALGIVIDTATSDRISNPKFALCRELVKIDHHIEVEPYGGCRWVEPERSSACEMIAALYAAHRDEMKITPEAATYLYLGMVTDSGRFQYDGVTGETLRLAGLMLDQGVDTQTLYAHLYLSDDESLRFKAYVYEHMQCTENGVAYIFLDRAVQESYGLSFEDASAAISYLDGIRGRLCWLAFIESPEDGSLRVRLRSRFMAINAVAEKYHGGGHVQASGAMVYNMEEAQALIRDADALTAQYKRTHDGWL